MLSQERIDILRNMTISQRLELLMQMIREFTPDLFVGETEIVDRRFELLNLQNDDRTRRICEGLAKADGRI